MLTHRAKDFKYKNVKTYCPFIESKYSSLVQSVAINS